MQKNFRKTHGSMRCFIHLFQAIAAISPQFAMSQSGDVLQEVQLSGGMNKGVSLIQEQKFSEASSFYDEEIKKNEANREAYFNRGIAKWQLSDTMSACRDWSAVLAMGDTATFKLLDSKCNGEMVLEEDTIQSAQYRQMWGPVTKKPMGASGGHSTAATLAEVMPEFPGGETALFNYLWSNTRYPEKAKKDEIQGRVYVSFVVSSKGKVLYPYVVKGIGNGCDEEAIRVVKAMPLWKPGMQNGKPIPVRYTLPVKFVNR